MTIIHPKYQALAALLLLPALAGTAQEVSAEHFTVAPFEDPQALQTEPRELLYEVRETDLPPGVIIINTVEFDALFDVDLRALREVITDFDDYVEFVPRATRSNVLPLTASQDGPQSWLQEITLSFRVLFFGATYDYILRLDEVDLDRGGSYGLEYRLEQSLDGQFQDVHGSWYLQELWVEGERLTYVRYWNTTDFAEDSLGLETALKWFGPRDVRGNIMAFVDEARRRQKAAKER